MNAAEIFAEARKADIEAVAGVKLYRSGRRLRGPCPLCGGGKGKTVNGPFSADPQLGLFTCWKGCQPGDVIDLEHRLRSRGSETKLDAAKRLAGAVELRAITHPEAQVIRAELAVAENKSGRYAERIWREARPAVGSLAEHYLARRGITGDVAQAALRRLRFHPRAFHSSEGEGADRRSIILPAMVAQVTTPEGPTGGFHLTYLDPVTARKAPLENAKMMYGPQTLNGQRGGVWLTSPVLNGDLLVGEGIESTLSAAVLMGGRKLRVVATLSLRSLQGGYLMDQWGRIDPEAIEADPEKPAFSWPLPDKRPWNEVLIAVDRDMKGWKVKLRKFGGGTIERKLSSEERARICASLAIQTWKRTGAPKVRAVAAAAGRDFNDELMRRLND